MALIIQRYIYTRLAYSLLAVSLVMTAFVLVFIFIGELEAQRNDYHMQEALWYTLMRAPSVIFELLPFTCLISVLMVMGNMVEKHEMVILHTSGVSITNIMFFVLSFIFVVISIFVVADHFVFSRINTYAVEFKAGHKYPNQQTGTIEFWVNENKTIMHLDSVYTNGKIGTSYIYTFDDDNNITKIQKSSSGQIQNRLFSFSLVDGTNISDASQVSTNTSTSIQLDTDYHLDFRRFEQIEPKFVSLTHLLGVARYQMQQKEGPNSYWATFMWKLLLPVNISALVFLALSLVCSSKYLPSAGSRVFIGVMVSLVFYFINNSTVPAHMALNVPALITTLFPGLLALTVGLAIRKFV